MLYEIPDIRNNQSGYEKIALFHLATRELFADSLELSFEKCSFFEANMSAPLAAVLVQVANELNHVQIVKVPKPLKNVLCRNEFLGFYGYECLPDDKQTTTPFRRMRLKDAGLFAEYLEQNYRGRGLPAMTPRLTKALRQSIFEIYQNAVMHSESATGIYVCGQLYPLKHRLDFTLADAGIGFRTNVRRYYKQDNIDAMNAIRWAMQEGSTTKTGSQPGGMGLKFIKEFVRLNKGKLQIVSSDGFYEFSQGKNTFSALSTDFPGTVVNLEVNTADQQSYRLSSEIDARDIF